MAKKDKWHCRRPDCKYRGAHNTEVAPRCEYMLITGKSRLAQHPPGRQAPYYCTLYERGERQSRKNAMKARIKLRPKKETKPRRVLDWEKAKELWAAGATDKEVGAAIGCSADNAAKHRRSFGIEDQRHRLNPNKMPEDGLLHRLYMAGLNDRQLSKALCLDERRLYRWRKRQGIACNGLKISNQAKARELIKTLSEEYEKEGSHGRQGDELRGASPGIPGN